MLTQLSIKNYALIDDLNVSFKDGFNIITGETGSGKSIIIGALGLVLGERADSSIAKYKDQKSIVEAEFLIQNNLETFFTKNDLDFSKQTIIRREINTQGKSRAFINDTPVNLALLKEFSNQIIDIHSQHKTIELNNQKFQLNVVDALSNSHKEILEYNTAYTAYLNANKELNKLKETEEESKSNEAYYQFILAEFESLELNQVNVEELETEQAMLENSEEIKLTLASSIYKLDESELSILSALNEVHSELSKISSYNKFIEELTSRVDAVRIELKDVLTELQSTESEVEVNPVRLDQVNDVLNRCFLLQKKHNLGSIQSLIGFKNSIEEKLLVSSNFDELILKKTTEVSDLKEKALKLGDVLSKKRSSQFKEIESQVNTLFHEVAMSSAELKIESTKKELALNGIDDLSFYIKTNKGSDFQPIENVASGGELSRIMLVLKTILSDYNALPTIIFDEIDTGISGEVADKVGALIQRLSKNLQVFSITHLPQVASKGDHHYFVHKVENENDTQTHMTLLSKEDRVIELAKMMSGENPSKSTLQTAKELLARV